MTSPTPIPLAQRIAHTDPSDFRQLRGVHSGAGSMAFGSLLEATALSNNLIFLHHGVIAPHSGIGQHFHNQCEEMFVILDGEAQFTVDGRTSLIKGPAGVPCRMGHSHGIYNPTDKPVQWLNVNVGMTKVYDAWDLGDDCVNIALDRIPQFISMRLDRALLLPKDHLEGGQGVIYYRRALNPTIFSTTWAYVDHIAIGRSCSFGPRALVDVTEVYYILTGAGWVTVDGQTESITAGDAIPVDLGQELTLQPGNETGFTAMVIGIAKDMTVKARMMTGDTPFRN